MKLKKAEEDGEKPKEAVRAGDVKVTDYLHIVEPMLKARKEAFGETNEVEYLIKNRERLLDENEKSRFQRLESSQVQASENHHVAQILLQPGNDLKGVRIHEFKRYMETPGIVELCATSILSKLDIPKSSQGRQPKTSLSDIMELLATPIDKYLFVMFRDQLLTVD